MHSFYLAPISNSDSLDTRVSTTSDEQAGSAAVGAGMPGEGLPSAGPQPGQGLAVGDAVRVPAPPLLRRRPRGHPGVQRAAAGPSAATHPRLRPGADARGHSPAAGPQRRGPLRVPRRPLHHRLPPGVALSPVSRAPRPLSLLRRAEARPSARLSRPHAAAAHSSLCKNGAPQHAHPHPLGPLCAHVASRHGRASRKP